jgi:hypothetical protein
MRRHDWISVMIIALWKHRWHSLMALLASINANAFTRTPEQQVYQQAIIKMGFVINT